MSFVDVVGAFVFSLRGLDLLARSQETHTRAAMSIFINRPDVSPAAFVFRRMGKLTWSVRGLIVTHVAT